MSLRHIVLFRFNPDTTDAQVAEMSAGLDRLPGDIPEVGTYRHGRDAGVSEASWDYAIVGEFASPEDYLTYRDHPVHQDVIRTLVLPIVADRASAQLPD